MVQYNRETAITVRCDTELKEKAEVLAREKGQSLVEWIRRAIQDKIDRAESGASDDELEEIIRKVLLQMKAEQK